MEEDRCCTRQTVRLLLVALLSVAFGAAAASVALGASVARDDVLAAFMPSCRRQALGVMVLGALLLANGGAGLIGVWQRYKRAFVGYATAALCLGAVQVVPAHFLVGELATGALLAGSATVGAAPGAPATVGSRFGATWLELLSRAGQQTTTVAAGAAGFGGSSGAAAGGLHDVSSAEAAAFVSALQDRGAGCCGWDDMGAGALEQQLSPTTCAAGVLAEGTATCGGAPFAAWARAQHAAAADASLACAIVGLVAAAAACALACRPMPPHLRKGAAARDAAAAFEARRAAGGGRGGGRGGSAGAAGLQLATTGDWHDTTV